MKIKNWFLSFSILLVLFLLLAKKALAVCPICTIAVGAGVGFSQWLGIDDSITGLWIGGLTVSMIVWTESWFDKKNINFKFRPYITTLSYYLLVIVPLYFIDLIANPANAIYSTWLDPLLLGIIIGSLAFWFGALWYFDLKKKNNGHAYFPFQKVVMPIAPLAIISLIFYFLTL